MKENFQIKPKSSQQSRISDDKQSKKTTKIPLEEKIT